MGVSAIHVCLPQAATTSAFFSESLTRTNFQGCRLLPEGESLTASSTLAMASGLGSSGLKVRTLRLVFTTS